MSTIALINAGLGVSVGLALWWLGMPSPALFGVLAFVLNFIPYVGALLGVGSAVIVAIDARHLERGAAEVAFDEVAVPIEEGAEGRPVDASRHRLDVGSGAALGEAVAQRVAVVGAVGQQDLVVADGRGSWLSARPASAPCIGRERRPQWGPRRSQDPPFNVRAMLMDPDRRAVDHLQVAFIGGGEGLEDRVQTPSLRHRTKRL